MEPPDKELPRPIDATAKGPEPRLAQLRLIAQLMGRPLRRGPDPKDYNPEDGEYLANEEFGGGHDAVSRARQRGGSRIQASSIPYETDIAVSYALGTVLPNLADPLWSEGPRHCLFSPHSIRSVRIVDRSYDAQHG